MVMQQILCHRLNLFGVLMCISLDFSLDHGCKKSRHQDRSSVLNIPIANLPNPPYSMSCICSLPVNLDPNR